MCSAKSSGNNTLSCNVGSIGVPPEWPWIARRYEKMSGELGSTQYWNLFLIPPPLCEKLSHVRIDQYEEDVILNRNIDARSSFFTAPSSSRFTESSCRSNLIINFATIVIKCSWFHVYPLSFTIRNRHRRQRGIWCLSWFCLRNKFPCTPLYNTFNVSLIRHLRHVLVDSIHEPDPRASFVDK